jgi:hypothetical protein
MKIRKIIYPVIITSLFAMAALGAEDTKKPAPDRNPEAAAFDLSFPGGTVAEFVAQTEKAIDQSWGGRPRPNFVVPTEARSLKVPKVELRSVDMETLMNAMSTMLGREHMWQRVGGSTWVLYTRPDTRNTQAFFIGHLLFKFKIEDVTTAIETVWQMDAGKKADLKYHQDTRLLIIRADKAQLEMATNVLTQLRDALAFPDPIPTDSKPAPAQ